MPESASAATGHTRRRLLGAAASASLLSACARLPPQVQRALTQPPPRPASLSEIRHVVLMLQENRSFDHYFGTLAGVRGFDDPQALRLASGSSVFHQPDPEHADGYLLPFHLDTRASSAQKIPSTSHSWTVQHAAWNGGRMDNWIGAHRQVNPRTAPFVMGHYTRADIPFQFALAEAFTVCDAYHSSVLGPTWPNRMMWMTGTIDPEGAGGGPIIRNVAPRGGYRWTTYAERLQAAGVSWKVYQQHDNYGCNVLERFAAFQQARPGSALHERGMVRGAADAFEEDARHDRLPAVSWIIPTSRTSEHPNHLPAAGAAFVASKIEAVASNPAVWAKTLIVLAYDENDGLFDHVPPPVPPRGTAREFVDGLPIGAGFRVPCILISPWTAGGWVCSEPLDHTSALRLLEAFTGVREPNISDWRRATFGDLSSALRLHQPRLRWPDLPDARAGWRRAEQQVATLPAPEPPGVRQRPPRQEGGTRRHLPPA
jgi:phospholipase C